MKKLLGLILLMFISNAGFATHNQAGDISYIHISGTTYKIRVRTFTNTYNTSADRCELMAYFGDGDSLSFPRVNGSSVLCPNTADGQMIDVYTKLNIYEATHTYPGNGTYIISVKDPNRSAGICNITNSINTLFSLQAELVINPFLGNNNGSSYSATPIVSASIGVISYYNPLAVDTDGDSLHYELIPPVGTAGYSYPPAGNSFKIDSSTGTVKWDKPLTICNYVYDIKITEWRNVAGTRYTIGSTMQEIWVSVDASTEILENSNDIQLVVFPNPSTDAVNFSIENGLEKEEYTLEIGNALGQIIKTINFKTTAVTPLVITDLDPGIYFYTVKTSNSALSQGKFVILTNSSK